MPTYVCLNAGLYGKHLPITVSNFRSAVQQGLYTGTIFHKVLPGAFVQVRNPLSDPWGMCWEHLHADGRQCNRKCLITSSRWAACM